MELYLHSPHICTAWCLVNYQEQLYLLKCVQSTPVSHFRSPDSILEQCVERRVIRVGHLRILRSLTASHHYAGGLYIGLLTYVGPENARQAWTVRAHLELSSPDSEWGILSLLSLHHDKCTITVTYPSLSQAIATYFSYTTSFMRHEQWFLIHDSGYSACAKALISKIKKSTG
jgi:hypothetical protein